MKYSKYILICLLSLSLSNCEIDDLANPNGSAIEAFDQDATNPQLQSLVTGMEDLFRQEFGFYNDLVSIIGREYWFFTGSDPRYTGELLGKGESQLDNAGFYGTRPYFGRYKTIKNANIILDALNNTSFVSAEEAEGYRGFAKTFQAYELHLVANLQYTNGIRIDVADQENLGPFVDYDPALTAIADLLDEAAVHLAAAGASFPFTLSSAMSGFDTPATFLQFNRGLAARIALYQGNKSAALGFLAESFMNMDAAADMSVGPARFYSVAGGDFTNNIFRPLGQADAIIAHPTFVSDLLTDDARASKVVMRDDPLSLDDLTGDHDVYVFKSLEDFVPFMRNEELILIAAEANIGSDNDAAIAALDIVRTANGLDAYSGDNTDAAVTAELIFQRRYSLFGEGHRWVDMRRWGLLGDLPIDRPDDNVWEKLPRPVSEG